MPEDRTKTRRAYQRHRLERKRGDTDESNEKTFGDIEMNPISGSGAYESNPMPSLDLSTIRPTKTHAYLLASFFLLLMIFKPLASSSREDFYDTTPLLNLNDEPIMDRNDDDFSSRVDQPVTYKKKDELVFFNVLNEQGESSYGPLSSLGYKKNGPAIATLVTHSEKDLSDLKIALQSLAFLQGDNPKYPAPVLVFNEGDLTAQQIRSVLSATERPVAFPIVDLTTFPEGFQTHYTSEEPQYLVKNRKPWGYYQMIRFWITGIWKHPALDDFETIMRIDSDSCFKSKNEYLPSFAHNQLVYHSQFMGYEAYGDHFVKGLYEFVHKYVHEKGIRIKNALLWQFISTTWEAKGTLPLYNTNFELSRKSFMQRPDVMDFHESLTERHPYGVLTHRWGDAVLRMITVALFANDELIMQSAPDGYYHKSQCVHEDVLTALAMIDHEGII